MSERRAPDQPPPRTQWCVGEGDDQHCFDLAYDARTYGRRHHLGAPTMTVV